MECASVADWLHAEGFEPVRATTVSRALQELNERPFSLLVADFDFAFRGGLQAASRERMRNADFIAFLEQLLCVYSVGPIILIVDNASSHTAGAVCAWLADPVHARLQVHRLPTHCSHLNPVEAIWRRLKDQVAANRLHGSMRDLLATVDAFFGAMTPEQALQWAG